MGWYLMYWFFTQSRYRFIRMNILSRVCDQVTRARAIELGREIWLYEKENMPGLTDKDCNPEVVWRSPLESIQDDPVEAVSVDLGIHQPDETAEYEFYRLTEHEE